MISARLHTVFTRGSYAPDMDLLDLSDSSPIVSAGCDCPDATLVPEGSVPVSGFSRELRMSADARRYRFAFALDGALDGAPHGGFDTPVHVVFSPSARRAEIKAADLKLHVVENVGSACEAKRRWIAWWRGGRTAGAFTVPSRTGRMPPSPTARPTS